MTLAVPTVTAGGRRRQRRGAAASATSTRPTRRYLRKATVTLFAVMLVRAYLLPLAYGFISGLKSDEQMTDPRQPILPQSAETGDDRRRGVPGHARARSTTAPASSPSSTRAASRACSSIPPNPTCRSSGRGAGARSEPATTLDPHWDNFSTVAETLDLPKLLFNTGVIAGLGMAGTVISSVLVAYGLSRFNVPFEKLIMASLIAAIILPRFVTIVPAYAVYQRLGWIGTWLPLIVPHFFANAYNVFLLRAFFMTIPRELDEAATIDGAGPLRILMTIIVPQARAAIVAVALFHFFFAWNDFFEPFVYLAGDRDKYPISVGLYGFIGLYDSSPHLIQAGAMIAMAIPIARVPVRQALLHQGHRHQRLPQVSLSIGGQSPSDRARSTGLRPD